MNAFRENDIRTENDISFNQNQKCIHKENRQRRNGTWKPNLEAVPSLLNKALEISRPFGIEAERYL